VDSLDIDNSSYIILHRVEPECSTILQTRQYMTVAEYESGVVILQHRYNKVKPSVSARLDYFIGVAEALQMIHVVDSKITG
jgi:hypothetical protein